MKKILIYGLSLALVLSLTACHKSEPEQPTEPTATPAATSEPVQEPTVSPEPTADTTPEKLTSTTPAASTEPENTQPMEDAEPQEPVEEVQLFTDCNETVYATGTVNLRASWSAESEKLGSLNAGQSITRTGVSISGTEAEGWSRVVLADNTVAYVSNKYLSTTKPVINSNNSSSTQQQQGQTQQGQTQQGQNQQSTQQQPTQQTSKGSGPKALDPSMQAALDAEANKTWDTEHVNGDLSNLTEEQAKALGDADFRSWARLAGWSEEQIRHALGED